MWLNNKNEIYLNIYEKELKKRKEEYENTKLQFVYQKVISEEADLLKKLVPEQKLDYYFTTYYYLLKKGYLSVNHKFETSIEPMELSYERGISITNGNGCCRNICLHLKNILKCLNIGNVIVIGTAQNGRSQDKTVNPENMSVHSRTKINTNSPNHMEILDLNDLTIYDPTQFKIRKLEKIKRNGQYNLIDSGVRIYMDFTIPPQCIKKINEASDQTEKILSSLLQTRYDKNKLERLKLLGAKICSPQIEQLEHYQEKHQPVYEYIKEETLKRRNR